MGEGSDTGLKAQAKQHARRAALALAGGLAALVGAGFLTAAAWQALAGALSPPLASLLVGAVYLGAAGLLLVFALRKPHKEAPSVTSADILTVFLKAVQAGRAARS